MTVIWGAVITGLFAVIVALIEKMGKANAADHAAVVARLDQFDEKLDDVVVETRVVAKRLDEHILVGGHNA